MYGLSANQLRWLGQQSWQARGEDYQESVAEVLGRLQELLNQDNYGFIDVLHHEGTLRFYERAWDCLFVAEPPRLMDDCCRIARQIYELVCIRPYGRCLGGINRGGCLYERRNAHVPTLPVELWDSFATAARELFERQAAEVQLGQHVTLIPRGTAAPAAAHDRSGPRQLMLLESIHVQRCLPRLRFLPAAGRFETCSAAAAA